MVPCPLPNQVVSAVYINHGSVQWPIIYVHLPPLAMHCFVDPGLPKSKLVENVNCPEFATVYSMDCWLVQAQVNMAYSPKFFKKESVDPVA